MRWPWLFLLLFESIPSEAQVSKNISLLCNWNDSAHITLNGAGARYNDCWGFSWKGKEYGIIGSSEGMHIIDVDDCRQVAFARGNAYGYTSLHRDFKTYKHYIYAVADEGYASMQVFDFSTLPDSLHLVYESDPMEFSRSHTIFIDTATAKLYCASATNLSTGHDNLRIYSLADPEHPSLLSTYNYGDNVHAVFVRNDTAYCSQSFLGYLMVDFTQPAYQIIGGLLEYPDQGYNHSSWVGPHDIGVMADETHGMSVKVIDTHDPLNVEVLSTFSPRPHDSTCIAHNPYLLGHYAVVSYYYDGLQIYDISDPRNPVQAGYYHTYPGLPYQGYAGDWGCYPFLPSGRILASDMQGGLFVLDADEAMKVKRGDSIVVYPNPVKDQLSILLPRSSVSGSVTLSDVTGHIVLSQSIRTSGFTAATLTLSSLPAGIYFLCIQAGDILVTRKLFKE